MSKKYLVWKDPNCNGKNIEWLDLSKDEFLDLVNQPESANRYFVKLSGETRDEIIYIEATEERYKAWKKEKNNEYYLRQQKQKRGFQEWPLAVLLRDLNEEFVADIVSLETETLEDFAERDMFLQNLQLALKELPQDELDIVVKLYLLKEKNWTEREIAKALGISQVAVNKKKKKILKKLRNMVINFETG